MSVPRRKMVIIFGAFISILLFGFVHADELRDRSSFLQAAINKAGTVILPCGEYPVSKTIVLPSNIRLQAAKPGCVVIKQMETLAYYSEFTRRWRRNPARILITNADYDNGNSNITVQGIVFDMTRARVPGTNHVIQFYHGSDFHISEISCLGANRAGDCTAMIGVSNVTVSHSKASGLANACWDHWGGVEDALVEFNECDAGSSPASYGILFTGANTDASPNTSRRVRIISNTIRGANSSAIWIQGGRKPGSDKTGLVEGFYVFDNTIIGGKPNGGIRCSGAINGKIEHNKITGTYGSSISVWAEGPGSPIFGCKNVEVLDNTISHPGEAAIIVGDYNSGITIAHNTILDPPRRAAIEILPQNCGIDVKRDNIFSSNIRQKFLDKSGHRPC